MSIENAIAALAAILPDVDPSPEPALARIYAGPQEAANLGDFPLAIIYLTPGQQHAFREEAVGLARHDYTLTILVLLGSREATPIHELHGRAMRWPEPLARVIYANLSLQETVMFAGDGDASNTLITYQIGPFDWGAGKYFGVKVTLGITEKYLTEMDL